MIMEDALFSDNTPVNTNIKRSLNAERTEFKLVSSNDGKYKITYFADTFGKDLVMTLTVKGDQMETEFSPEGVVIKYFWKRDPTKQ